jgi:hypothetical protein
MDRPRTRFEPDRQARHGCESECLLRPTTQRDGQRAELRGLTEKPRPPRASQSMCRIACEQWANAWSENDGGTVRSQEYATFLSFSASPFPSPLPTSSGARAPRVRQAPRRSCSSLPAGLSRRSGNSGSCRINRQGAGRTASGTLFAPRRSCSSLPAGLPRRSGNSGSCRVNRQGAGARAPRVRRAPRRSCSSLPAGLSRRSANSGSCRVNRQGAGARAPRVRQAPRDLLFAPGGLAPPEREFRLLPGKPAGSRSKGATRETGSP